MLDVLSVGGSRDALCRSLRREPDLFGRVPQTGPVSKTEFVVALMGFYFILFFIKRKHGR